MSTPRHVELSEAGDITVVRFLDRRIIDTANIEELGEELVSLVDKEGKTKLVLNFINVEFLSSASLNHLIRLDRKLKAKGGKMRLCNLRKEIHEVFVMTNLNRLFDIKTGEAEALTGF